jgi:hypothetical protein
MFLFAASGVLSDPVGYVVVLHDLAKSADLLIVLAILPLPRPPHLSGPATLTLTSAGRVYYHRDRRRLMLTGSITTLSETRSQLWNISFG